MKHGRSPIYSWFPLYGEKWLFGSTRYELDHAERAIFIDLLALANRDNGFIRANEQFSYTIQHLSGMLHADVQLVETTLQKCVQFGKLERLENGIYKVKSWEDFSLTDRRKRYMVKVPKKRNNGSVSVEPPIISSNLISISSLSDLSSLSWIGITEKDRSSWKKAYPACDIDRQLSAMLEWMKSNPEKAVKKNYRRFIAGWLARSQERGGDMKSNPVREPDITEKYAAWAKRPASAPKE